MPIEEGIQGIPLFELDWEEGKPLVMKPKCRPIKANILEVAETNLIDCGDTFQQSSLQKHCRGLQSSTSFCSDLLRLRKDQQVYTARTISYTIHPQSVR